MSLFLTMACFPFFSLIVCLVKISSKNSKEETEPKPGFPFAFLTGLGRRDFGRGFGLSGLYPPKGDFAPVVGKGDAVLVADVHLS